MFNTGDLIIYGSTGVCRVEAISPRKTEKNGSEQLFYSLKPLYSECKITAPVDSDKLFMRPIISKEQAEKLIDELPEIQAEAYHSRVLRELSEHYETLLRSHSCEDLFEMTMSIYAKRKHLEEQKKKFGAVDERFMKRAEELLFGELAAALEIPRELVPAYIAGRLGETDEDG